MSIAELIMQGTKRSSESTAWVGDSLAKLGQQVGESLAQREQQKQAQAILPFLQQSMQESMQLAGQGQSGEAYAKLMPFITDPSVINNPNLMPAVGAALKMNQLASEDYLKKEQLRVREDMNNLRYGGQGGQEPSTYEQAAKWAAALNQESPVDGVTQPQVQPTQPTQPAPRKIQELGQQARDVYATKQSGMPAAQMPPTTEGIFEVPLPDAIGQGTLDKASLARGPVRETKQVNGSKDFLNDYVPSTAKLQKFIRMSDRFEDLDTFKRQDYLDKQSRFVFPSEQNKQEYINKLSKDKTIIPLNGELFAGVPGLLGVELPKEYEKWIVSSGNVGKGTSFSIKPEAQNKEEVKGAVKWLNDWQNASSTVSADSNLRDLISKAGGDILSLNLNQSERTLTPEESGKFFGQRQVKEYNASVTGTSDKTKLTEDQFKNLMLLKNLSVTANVNGAKFLRMETPEVQKPSVQQTPPQKTGQRKPLTDMFGNK